MSEHGSVHPGEDGWLLGAAVVPGLGHLLVGRTGRGLHLSVSFALLCFVLAFRWKAFIDALSSAAPGDWIASGFLLVALGALLVFSVRDLRGILRDRRTEEGGQQPNSGQSPLELAWRRFSENRLALASVYGLVILLLVAVLAPILAPHDPTATQITAEARFLPPSWSHPFGTDRFGRDLLSRCFYGARISLSIGTLAMLIAVSFGTVYGAVAGYVGGWIDATLMRLVDVLLAFPTMFLLLTLVGVFDSDIGLLVLILGFTSWTGTARFVRGEVLSLKEREFVDGARAVGLPDRTILFRHIIPNAMAPVLVNGALMVGGLISAEAALSFLGFGVEPPTPSWGRMISQGQDNLVSAWWVAAFPGGLLTATVLSFNLLADGFRDALDPKTLMRKYV